MHLSLEEQQLSDDRVYDFDEIKMLIHQQDFPYFEKTKLDYIIDPLGKGSFKLQRM